MKPWGYKISLKKYIDEKEIRKRLQKGCPNCGCPTMLNMKRMYRGAGWTTFGSSGTHTVFHLYDGYQYYYCDACDENFPVSSEERMMEDRNRKVTNTMKDYLLKWTDPWIE
jgi:ribosomal protein S27AE